MAETEALLPINEFLRIHRSYIVAKKYIQKFDKKSVWVNQTEIPIGALYLPELEKITINNK
jgi:DNA-binding LytR/AlgR family response regulator